MGQNVLFEVVRDYVEIMWIMWDHVKKCGAKCTRRLLLVFTQVENLQFWPELLHQNNQKRPTWPRIAQ